MNNNKNNYNNNNNKNYNNNNNNNNKNNNNNNYNKNYNNNNNDSIIDFLQKHDLSQNELDNLISASEKYLKFNTNSSNMHYNLTIMAKYESNNGDTIKISLYHDIKQVMYHKNEKSDSKITLQVIPGIKFCDEIQHYTNILEKSTSNSVSKNNLLYFMIFEIEKKSNGTDIPAGAWRNAFYPIEGIELKADEIELNKENLKLESLYSSISSLNLPKESSCSNKEDYEKLKKDHRTLIDNLDIFKQSFKKFNFKKNSINEEPRLFEIGNAKQKNKELYSNLQIRVAWGYDSNRALFQINYHNKIQNGEVSSNGEFDLVNLKNLRYYKNKQCEDFEKLKPKDESIYMIDTLKKEKWESKINELKNEIIKIDEYIKDIQSKLDSANKENTDDLFITETKMKQNFEEKWKLYNKSFFNIRREISELKILKYNDFIFTVKDILKKNLPNDFKNIRFDAMCT